MAENSKPITPPVSTVPEPTHRHRDRDDESIKETFESVVIAFILAFVFRAYVVEAFVIPTGSMAPTLLGDHYDITCDKCGYNYPIDVSRNNPPDEATLIPCSMCHFPNAIKQALTDGTGLVLRNSAGDVEYRMARVKAGDRILVQKYVNSMLRRYDVVVFKAPHQPFTNYIKRLIALEGEALQIIEGNIYINGTPDDESGWRIARKTDPNENPHAEKIQATVWQPIYHSQYVPLDWQKPVMRQVDNYGQMTRHGRDEDQIFRVPWVADNDSVENTWKTASGTNDLDPSNGYRHESNNAGRIRFDFARFWTGGPGYFPYGTNYGQSERWMDNHRVNYNIPVEDVRLAASFQPEADGLEVTLRTTCRMDDPKGVMRVLFATVDKDGNVTLGRKDDLKAKQSVTLATATVKPFAARESRRVALWYVDQEASVVIDGERVLTVAFDLPIEVIRNRARPCELLPGGHLVSLTNGNILMVPEVAIEVTGSPVSIHRVELDRDLFYMPADLNTDHRASLIKDRDDRGQIVTYGQPKVLKKNEFFCMGDNSPFSLDGRGWTSTDYWVKRRTFADGTLDEDANGVVPARLMMGRAFFVYFPAMHGLNDSSPAFIPNFGDMRFIH